VENEIGAAGRDAPAGASRRETLRLGSGAALAALIAALSGGRVLAHDATPEAGPGSVGNYSVIRIRKIKADASGEEVTARVEEGFVPLIREMPGFVSYVVLWNAETRDWVSISTFTDKAAADGRRVDRAGRSLRGLLRYQRDDRGRPARGRGRGCPCRRSGRVSRTRRARYDRMMDRRGGATCPAAARLRRTDAPGPTGRLVLTR
jgi:hypothetical protein